MKSFISETLNDILKTTYSFKEVVFIVPSQRAGVFIKQSLKENPSVTGFLPEILNIEEFVSNISEIEKVDTVELLFHFYSIYKELESSPDSFDVFSSWAFTVLQDFNEIDQHLINSKDIFIFLRDVERLRKWSVKGTFQETELMKDHFYFLEKLNDYYTSFYTFLCKKSIGYQGVLYREAVEKATDFISKNTHKKFFFIGFNALNKAEEILFKKFLSAGNSEIYWDIDKIFLNNNHQAGSFIRKYKSEWKYYEKKSLKLIGNWFSNPKDIQVIGASKNITQIKYVGEILSTYTHHNNTALVLADETLLPITLNSLPKNVKAINITMGYPLKDIPTTSLIISIFQLFITQNKLQKTSLNVFYHKDVIRFLKHPNIYKLLSENQVLIEDLIASQIVKNNATFVNETLIDSFFKNIDQKEILEQIFAPFNGISNFLDRIINLISFIKEHTTELEKEYLFRFYTIFTQLQTLHTEFSFVKDLKTLYSFFKQLIQSENLSFQGEPLQGLQLMGMLETRVLDFENIILTSVNEGILPTNNNQTSFIPFDAKVQFGLPTYREKDAIFSYHFFRLIQRAKNVFILYNTESDAFGSGEKSRFVTQLEMLKGDVNHKIVSPKVVTFPTPLKEIKKNDAILKKLKELAIKGISPSSFTNYLYNPIAFYKQKVLKIRELENIEETIAANTMGTVVHDTLDELYTPFIGKFISANTISLMQQKAKELVKKYFTIWFKNGDIYTGKNRLIYEVANRFVQNFLSQEKQLLQEENNQLKIIATEQNLSAIINVEGIDFPIKIHGQVDRIDQLNGVTRIIDYKTGMVSAANLKITDFEQITDLKHHKAIQVLLYTYLYTQTTNFNFENPLEAGIISFKNLKSGFLKMNFSSNYRTPNTTITPEVMENFLESIKVVLEEIYNPKISFIEPADLPY